MTIRMARFERTSGTLLTHGRQPCDGGADAPCP